MGSANRLGESADRFETKTRDEIFAKLAHHITNHWVASNVITEIFSLSGYVQFAKRELSVFQWKGLYQTAF
jgi:hypothetical protein